MSDPIKDQLSTNLQKAKTEGRTRATRIRDIVWNASSQAFAEVKEGAGTLSEIAQNTFDTVTVNLSDGSQPSEETNRATSPDLLTSIVMLFTVIKDRLVTQLREPLAQADRTLTERYSDRYIAGKQRVGQAVNWYKSALETASSNEFQQKQAEAELKVGRAGELVARKEQQIRQQLKSFLQSAVAKI